MEDQIYNMKKNKDIRILQNIYKFLREYAKRDESQASKGDIEKRNSTEVIPNKQRL